MGKYLKKRKALLYAKLEKRYAEDTKQEDISHLFDTLKSAAQSEIKAYFVHAALKAHFIEDTPSAGDKQTRRPGDKVTR